VLKFMNDKTGGTLVLHKVLAMLSSELHLYRLEVISCKWKLLNVLIGVMCSM